MEVNRWIKKKLKIASIMFIFVSTAGLYLLKGLSYDVMAISPINTTQSSTLIKRHGYYGNHEKHDARENNSPLDVVLHEHCANSFDSVSDIKYEITTESVEQRAVKMRPTQAALHSVMHSGPSPDRESTLTRKETGKTLLGVHFKSGDSKNSSYDIMATKAISFDPAYKNPCWKRSKTKGPLNDTRLNCLPYFYIIGVKKSATSDLYERIMKHPDTCYPGFKESQWMARLRFGFGGPLLKFKQIHELLRHGSDVRRVSFYVSMYDEATKCIHSHPRTNNETQLYGSVTGDATPSLMHMHTQWQNLPGNKDLEEPKYTNFHYIKHLTPHAKIIVLFREPVSRLYSDFHHTMKKIKMDNASKLFHDHVTKLVKAYKRCFMDYTVRQCIYNNTLRHILEKDGVNIAESFHTGYYAFFMKELLSVFRRDQILPLLMSDYITDMKATLQRVYSFLELVPPGKKAMEEILKLDAQNSGQARKSRSGDMFKKTKSLLRQFYQPYNDEMAKLMDDPRYLFEES